MTKYLIAIFFLSLSTLVKAQNISLDQAISLRTKSLAYIEEFLTSKKWEMIQATEATEDKMGWVDFAYNKSNYDDKAESFITFYYGSIYTRLSIQVNKITTYNLYMSRVKSLGYKLEKSNIEEGSIVKIYKANGNTIRIKTSTQDDYSSTKTTYSFLIFNSLDFALEFDK